MGTVFLKDTTLKNIGNAIRSKTGKSNTLTPSEMVTEINGIPSVPTLNNPACAENIQIGFEAVDGSGNVIVGTHTEASAPSLPTLSAPASAGDILSDKEVINANGAKVTGSMPNLGAVNKMLQAGHTYIIEKGYHNGNGMIVADSLYNQTPADATAADIVSGKTAWVNGQKVTGEAEEANIEFFEVSTDEVNLSSIPAPFPTTKNGTIKGYGISGVKASGNRSSSRLAYTGQVSHTMTSTSDSNYFKEFIWEYDPVTPAVLTPLRSTGVRPELWAFHGMFMKEVTE